MQRSSAANEEQALVTGQLLFISPPVLSRGRCHASSLIASQISMSLYDTPGSSLVRNISTLTGFVGQPVLSYGCPQHMYLIQLVYTEVMQTKYKMLEVVGERNLHTFVFQVLYLQFHTKLSILTWGTQILSLIHIFICVNIALLSDALCEKYFNKIR